MQHELAARQRFAQALLHGTHALGLSRHLAVEQFVAVLAALLATKHRHVGALHERRPIARAVRRECDADRGRDRRLPAIDRIRPGDHRQHLFGEQRGVLVRVDLRQQDRELVPAQAGHRVLPAHRGGQRGRDLRQELVARHMAVGVVHLLEVVEIHKQQRRREAVAAGVQQRLVQAVEKERAVGKAGERVEVRLPVEPLLMLLPLAARCQERFVLESKAPGESDDKSAQCRIKYEPLSPPWQASP